MAARDPAREPTGRANDRHRGFRLYLACALAVMLILSLYYIIQHRVLAFVDIGIDTFSYYYPLQIVLSRQLHELHTFAWSFDAGLGSYIGWASNLSMWIKALLPESWQLVLRLPTYLLKLLLAGGFLFGYLRKLGFKPKLAAIGGLAFAFCGYAMVNGQWDTQGYVIPQLAAYLFFFESYFRSRNPWFAVAAGFTVGSGAVFDTYSFTLLSVLYVIARPFLVDKQNDVGAYIPSLFRYAGWAALGVLVTAVSVLPNMIYLLSSPRVSGNHSILHSLLASAWSPNDFRTIAPEVAGMFGKSTLGTASHYHGWYNWFEAPGFYVGMLMLVCIPQLLGPSATRRERWVCLTGLVLLLVYLLWPFMRYAVYGFGHRGFRLSTLWISFGLLMLGVAGLRRAWLTGPWRSGLIVSGVGMLLVMLAVALRLANRVNIQHIALAMAFTLVYCALLWPSKEGRPRVSMTALACVFACELLIFAIPPMMHRNAVKTDGTSTIGSYHDGTMPALALVRKLDGTTDFYRIEKTYRSVYLNDALVQGYSGTKSYFFHGKSITRFVDKMHLPRPHPRTGYIGHMTGRPKVLDLLGVKYLLARDRKLDKNPGMAYLGSAGKIHVYRNTDAHGVAHLYHEIIGEDAADKLPREQRDALLLEKVAVDDPVGIRKQLLALDAQDAGPRSPAQVSLKKISDVQLHVDVSASRAGVLLIAMPFDRGWKATVDGAATGLFRADYGLTALLLSAGSHQVELHYAVRGRAIGKWLSLAALIALLAVASAQAIVRRRRRTAEPATKSTGEM